MALLVAAVWADLRPIYWILETLSWLLSTLTNCYPIRSPDTGGADQHGPAPLEAKSQLRIDSSGTCPRQRHRAGGCPADQKPLEQGTQHRGLRRRHWISEPSKRLEALQQLLLPNLLVSELVSAIKCSRAPRL